jgi:hypothetical protein
MKRKNISEVVEYLENLEYDETIHFRDNNFNDYWLFVEESWISIDDSIPEEEITEEDMEFYPVVKIQCENYNYHNAKEVGDTIPEAAARALHTLNLIDEQTLNRFINQE